MKRSGGKAEAQEPKIRSSAVSNANTSSWQAGTQPVSLGYCL